MSMKKSYTREMGRTIVVTEVKCDFCGRTLGAADHWILYRADTYKFGKRRALTFCMWDNDMAELWSHLCSEECAVKVLRRTLNLQNEEPTQ